MEQPLAVATNGMSSDYDSQWKEALERYFEDFLALFFPEAHEGIDWGTAAPCGAQPSVTRWQTPHDEPPP